MSQCVFRRIVGSDGNKFVAKVSEIFGRNACSGASWVLTLSVFTREIENLCSAGRAISRGCARV